MMLATVQKIQNMTYWFVVEMENVGIMDWLLRDKCGQENEAMMVNGG